MKRRPINGPQEAAGAFDGRWEQSLKHKFVDVCVAGHLPGWIGLLSPSLGRRLSNRLNTWGSRTVIHCGQGATETAYHQILLVTHDLSASGAPKIVLEIARALRHDGMGVTVLSPEDGPMRLLLTQIGAGVVLNRTALAPRGAIVKTLAVQCDAAICNTALTSEAVRKLSTRLPTFWYIHEVSLLAKLLADSPRLPLTLTLPHIVWAGSELPARLIRPHRAAVQVLPYGLDPLHSSVSRVPGSHEGPLKIGLFGSIESRKGQDLAVEAVRRLSSEHRDAIELSIYGRVLDPLFNESLKKETEKLPNVHLCGELDSDAYSVAMRNCDAVLVSSRDDTLPLVSLDALGIGRVLLCTPTTGTSAYLDNGVNGFVSTHADAQSIAAMLASAIARRSEWPTIGHHATAVFARVFSRDAFARTLLSSITTVIEEAAGTPA